MGMLKVGGKGDVKGKVLSSPCRCVSSLLCVVVATCHHCPVLMCPRRLLSWPHPCLVSSSSSRVRVASLCQVVIILCLSKVNWDECGMGDTHCGVQD